eukprot:gene3098-5268_t
MKLTTPTTLVLLIFFVFVQLTSASWQTTKTDFVLNAQVTKVFPYSTAAVIVRFFVNCSDPCSVNLVNNTEVNKIKNDEPYVSIYSQLTTSASYTDTSFIKNGLSLVIKNKQATDPMNTWVISEQTNLYCDGYHCRNDSYGIRIMCPCFYWLFLVP